MALAAGIKSAVGQQTESWQAISLQPVRQFARLSQQGDIDEGKFSSYNSFLSAGYRDDQALGTPGRDAAPQPYRRHPYGVALSSDESKLYVTLEGNEAEPASSVLVVDTSTQKVIREAPVGRRPLGITLTPSGRYLVVANQYSNFLSVLDTTSDSEVLRIPGFFFNQKVIFVPARGWMIVTNRAYDSLEVYEFRESPLTVRFQFRVILSNDNRPFMLSNDPGYGLGGPHQTLIGRAPGFGNTEFTTPTELVRHLTNVNPRDLVVVGKYVYVANVNGLGVSVIDLDSRRQVASIDLNAPALDVLAMGPYVFVSTLGRFAQGFDDVTNEIAVVDTRADPLRLRMRYTSAVNPPYGPELGPGKGALVPASGHAPYLSAFGDANFLKTFPYNRDVFLQIADGFPQNPDNLPAIVGGAFPEQLATVDQQLVVGYAASDEIEAFAVDFDTQSPVQILSPVAHAFTNGTQTAFPTAIDRRALFEDGPYLLGKDDPDYFRGRMPEEITFASSQRKLYVANRLGESITVFNVASNGKPTFDTLIDLLAPGAPPFPATLAELGEDFYTSSRVSLNRDIACLSCHPEIHTDSKLWHVGSTAGRAMRLTRTNRNLRDTPPFYRSGIRRNLEAFRGTFRAMAPEGPFGFFANPAPFDANGDGTINDKDRGRTTADVNRTRMFALERTGVGFEKTSAAIAAFMEVEPRLLPNPFHLTDGTLSRSVPIATDSNDEFVIGDAVRGESVFHAAGCPTCHTPPVFTNNKVLSWTDRTMQDMNGDGIPDGIVVNRERTIFDRLPIPWEQYRFSLKREGLPFTSIDTDARLNYANTANNFTRPEQMVIPRSAVSGRLLVSGVEPSCPRCGDTPENQLISDTRNINVQSLRGVWDGGPFLEHGRAVDLFSVQTRFNDLQRHGDALVLGIFDAVRPWANRNYVDLAAFLKSIE